MLNDNLIYSKLFCRNKNYVFVVYFFMTYYLDTKKNA